jgi:hypothetical protein
MCSGDVNADALLQAYRAHPGPGKGAPAVPAGWLLVVLVVMVTSITAVLSAQSVLRDEVLAWRVVSGLMDMSWFGMPG